MKTLRARIWPSIALLLSIVSSNQKAAAKDYLAYISDSPDSSVVYWVAKDTGLFKKQGLDLEMVFMSGSTRGIQGLISGDLSFAAAVGPSVINGKLAGGDVAIISSVGNTLPYYIVGKSEIKSPEELKGKSAAVHIPGTAADFALRLALKRVGISYRDIKAIMVGGAPGRFAALKTGQVDFTVVTESGKIDAERSGFKVVIDMAKLNVPFQFACTATTGRIIRQNPDMVYRLVRSLAEAVHYFKTHKDESIKIMQRYTLGQSRAVLEGSYSAYRDLLVEDLFPTLEGLKNTLEVQASFDPKAAKTKAEDFVDLRFVDELKKSGFIDKLYGRR
jgi:NitT/TauT family transport system substrate-binding protein